MYHLDPVVDAGRAIDALEHDRLEEELVSKLRAHRVKKFKQAMIEAIMENPRAKLPVEGHSKRPAIDVAFCDATDETHSIIFELLRDGASGKDVKQKCKDVIDNFAENYSEYSVLSGVIAS